MASLRLSGVEEADPEDEEEEEEEEGGTEDTPEDVVVDGVEGVDDVLAFFFLRADI